MRGSLRARQVLVVALLFGGYAACYFCRADLSVATPLLIEDLARRGVSHDEAMLSIGAMSSFGVLAYALGKMFLGGLGDFWGGRRSFVIGVGGAAVFTCLFALGGGLPIFTLAWIGNRLTQSITWAGLLKITSKWFDYTSYGSIIGILSISYLLGDAIARQSMGALLAHGFGWRTIFYFAAAVAGSMLAANFLFLRESRVDAGFDVAKPNPLNLFGGSEERPASLAALLAPLIRSRAFALVCLLSLGCTIVRETFNTWTPVYLRDYAGYGVSSAASFSSIFPAVGVASVLSVGWLSDRLGENGRSQILFFGLMATAAALAVLTGLQSGVSASLLPVIVIGVIAFCLLGPYSYLGGAFALDFGGKQAGAISSGIIDGIGYLGGVLAGNAVARVSVRFGWQGVFGSLAAITALSAVAAGFLYWLSARARAAGRQVA